MSRRRRTDSRDLAAARPGDRLLIELFREPPAGDLLAARRIATGEGTDQAWGSRPLLTVLSSRIGRAPDRRPGWLDALGRVVRYAERTDRVLIRCEGTTCDRWLRHLGDLRPIRVGVVELPSHTDDWDQWWQRVARRLAAPIGMSSPCWFVSPCVEPRAAPELESLPLADRALASLADELHVLYVRPQGNLHRLLDAAFTKDAFRDKRVVLALGPDCVPASLARGWRRQGAITWDRTDATEPRDEEPPVADLNAADSATQSIKLGPDEAQAFLFHWTRRSQGPWPDQSEADYVRDLLFRPAFRDRSASAALERILRMQRLLATRRLIRGQTAVVSFTARPLEELARLRTFRPHQQRWDFECYGIGIETRWLAARGARPVRYGDAELWEHLPQAMRPFYQCERSGKADWRSEAEWRHVGDLDLGPLPNDRGLVFVPNAAAANRIAPLSRWPLAVLDRLV